MEKNNCKNMFILLFIITAFVITPAVLISSTTGKISGKVIDSASGKPLPGAFVIIEGLRLGAATDVNGDYFILDIPPGVYNLRAEMMGYRTMVQKNVRASIDLTTRVDFFTKVQALESDEIVVVAERPIIQPDISGSMQIFNGEELSVLPSANIMNVIKNQVSFNNVGTYDDQLRIRGSAMEESLFIVDGVSQGDALTNRPFYQVNLDAVQEVSVVTGGFSAKYGNLRSGMIIVDTKDGGQRISASANIQYSPPGLKHFGPMMFGFDSPVSQPFVNVWDSDGNWDPNAPSNTGEGLLDYSNHGGKPKPYSDFFRGWNTIAQEEENADWHYAGDNPTQEQINRSAMELYARWLWRHRSQDSIDELKKLENMGIVGFNKDTFDPNNNDAAWHQYGVEPDYKIQTTLGGPLPFLNKFGNTTFFLTYDQEQMEYAYRPPQRVYLDNQIRFKISSQLRQNLKLQLSGYWSRQKGGSGGQAPALDGRISNNPYEAIGSRNKLWYPNCAVTGQQTRQIYGLSLNHILSKSTFYEIKINYFGIDYAETRDFRNTAPVPGTIGQRAGIFGEIYPNGLPSSGDKSNSGIINGAIGPEWYADSLKNIRQDGWENWENWAKIKIGDVWYDEAPRGFGAFRWLDVTGFYRMESCNVRHNDTYQKTWEVLGNIVKQLNRSNRLEAGFELRRDAVHMLYEQLDPSVSTILGAKTGDALPELKGGFYLADKLEFPGFISNLGVRIDWLRTAKFPLIDSHDPLSEETRNNKVNGPYNPYVLVSNIIDPETGLYNTYKVIPLAQRTKIFVSPRMGVSHPISTTAKIFFNYGHMYQWPSIMNRYMIEYSPYGMGGIRNFYQPWIDPPRTIAYEIGYEQNLFDKMNLRTTLYYKDINNVEDEVRFYNTSGSWIEINFPGKYRDTRGLETFLEVRPGVIPYISGWASYNWMASNTGHFGFDRFYEDPSQQPRQVPGQVSISEVRPIIKLNVDFHTPQKFGPSIGNNFSLMGGLNISLLYYWRRGASFTWNPAQIPLVENNLRWKAYQRWDFRLSKDLFSSGSLRSVFYIDIRNLFDNRNMIKPSDLEQDIVVNKDSDRWGWDGHKWWKTEKLDYFESLGYVSNNEQQDGTFRSTNGQPGENKGDLPAFTPLTFLEKRDVWFGFKIYF